MEQEDNSFYNIPQEYQNYFIQIFNLLEKSIIEVYEIFKDNIGVKIELNETVKSLERTLRVFYIMNRVNNLMFIKEIPKICCKIYEQSFKLVLNEIGSNVGNLEYADLILKQLQVRGICLS